jgi:hypothetical protein
VIAVDTQILVYAFRETPLLGEKAMGAIRSLVEGDDLWAIPWPCVHEFVNTVTRPRYFDPPSSLANAFDFLHELAVSSLLKYIGERPDHLLRLRGIAEEGGVVGGQIHDARIAAICLSHGVTELWTADRDFSRFPALRTKNPLL